MSGTPTQLSSTAIMNALAELLREQNAKTDEQFKQRDDQLTRLSEGVDNRIAGIDGSEVLRSVNMALLQGQMGAVQAHLDEIVLKKSTHVSGELPVFVKSIMSAGRER